MSELSAEAILMATHPGQVFNLAEDMKSQLRLYRSRWHPDRNTHPQADEVLEKIHSLFRRAEKAAGLSFDFVAKDGKTHCFRYELCYLQDGCEVRTANGSVWVHLPDGFRDIAQTCVNHLQWLQRGATLNDRAKRELLPLIPIVSMLQGDSGNSLLCFGTQPDLLPLRFVLQHFQGKLPIRTAAWIGNRLFNQAVFCETVGLVNHSFSLDSFFVNPHTHLGCDVTGWLFSAMTGKRLQALPLETVRCCPPALLHHKIADPRVDAFLVKRTLLQLLGDPTAEGRVLYGNPDLPERIIDWLRLPPAATNLETFKQWGDLLQRCLGPPAFFEMGITRHDVIYEFIDI